MSEHQASARKSFRPGHSASVRPSPSPAPVAAPAATPVHTPGFRPSAPTPTPSTTGFRPSESSGYFNFYFNEDYNDLMVTPPEAPERFPHLILRRVAIARNDLLVTMPPVTEASRERKYRKIIMAYAGGLLRVARGGQQVALVTADNTVYETAKNIAAKMEVTVELEPKTITAGKLAIYSPRTMPAGLSPDVLGLAPPAPALALAAQGLAPALHATLRSCGVLVMLSPWTLSDADTATLRSLRNATPETLTDRAAPAPAPPARLVGVTRARGVDPFVVLGEVAALPVRRYFIGRNIDELNYTIDYFQKFYTFMFSAYPFNTADTGPRDTHPIRDCVLAHPASHLWPVQRAHIEAQKVGPPPSKVSDYFTVVTHASLVPKLRQQPYLGCSMSVCSVEDAKKPRFDHSRAVYLLTYNSDKTGVAKGALTTELLAALPPVTTPAAAIVCPVEAPLAFLASLSNRWFTCAVSPPVFPGALRHAQGLACAPAYMVYLAREPEQKKEAETYPTVHLTAPPQLADVKYRLFAYNYISSEFESSQGLDGLNRVADAYQKTQTQMKVEADTRSVRDRRQDLTSFDFSEDDDDSFDFGAPKQPAKAEPKPRPRGKPHKGGSRGVIGGAKK